MLGQHTPLSAMDYLKRILTAPVYDVAKRSPLQNAPHLSQRLGQHIQLKREDLQPIFSFKIRGAYNHLIQLSPEQRNSGVVAASAGNHAQGVALAAHILGVKARIVMPLTTPEIKINAVKRHGATVTLHGDDYDTACQYAHEIAEQQQIHFIHPFDDPDVIAGQGTIGMEILQQCEKSPDAIFIPVGGGGLIAGISAYVKALSPETRIIGVEPEDAASLDAALRAGQRVDIGQPGLFADGVAVKQVGIHTFEQAQRYVDEVVLVSVDQICAAMRDIFEETRALVEPAGALAVAGMNQYAPKARPNQHWVGINSGANVNFSRLSHVVERSEIGSGNEVLLAVSIPEQPGSFLKFCQLIGRQNISEFNYRYSGPDEARVFVGLQVGLNKASIINTLRKNTYSVEDLSDNELAKLHIRHLVGGRLPSMEREVLYRFEFPERPGALLNFLEVLAGRWNISLFHYRNLGSAVGRVLVGLSVPIQEQIALNRLIKATGYRAFDETNNNAYLQFLATPQSYNLLHTATQ